MESISRNTASSPIGVSAKYLSDWAQLLEKNVVWLAAGIPDI